MWCVKSQRLLRSQLALCTAMWQAFLWPAGVAFDWCSLTSSSRQVYSRWFARRFIWSWRLVTLYGDTNVNWIASEWAAQAQSPASSVASIFDTFRWHVGNFQSFKQIKNEVKSLSVNALYMNGMRSTHSIFISKKVFHTGTPKVSTNWASLSAITFFLFGLPLCRFRSQGDPSLSARVRSFIILLFVLCLKSQ